MSGPAKGPSVTYGYDNLGRWAEAGAHRVQFWCVSPGCGQMTAVRIDELIKRVGADASFPDLARKARCRKCGARGCHVQPADPPRAGQRDYDAWVQTELARCHQFIRWAKECFHDF